MIRMVNRTTKEHIRLTLTKEKLPGVTAQSHRVHVHVHVRAQATPSSAPQPHHTHNARA